MKKARHYQHTNKYLQKKAQQQKEKRIAKAKRKAAKKRQIIELVCSITPMTIILCWLEVKYDITEMEYLFGSVDFTKIRIIQEVRTYIDLCYTQNENPTVEGLEDHLIDVAIGELCLKLGLDTDVFDSLKSYKVKKMFIENALGFVYYYESIDENLINSLKLTKEELINSAKNGYDEICKNDLRKGSKEVRNKKRFDCAKLILKYFEQLENKTITIKKLAQDNNLNRNTLGELYTAIRNLLKLGQKIDEHTFDEAKRGRKTDTNPKITMSMLNQLEIDLEDIPEKCGLNYASWTGEAIQVYFQTFYNLHLSMKYLYKFLHNHNIISKFACRKNPKADPEEVAAFKKNIYSKFKEAIVNHETIVFLDETQVQQGAHARGFAKKGKKAVYAYHTENLHTDYTILTVIGFDFVMIFKHKGAMHACDYAQYLLELHIKYPEKHFVVFRDNARIHTAKELGEIFIKNELNKFMRFEPLPKYSPDLNPVELFNNEFKSFLKINTCENKKEVSQEADSFIENYQDRDKNSKIYGRRKARQYMKGQECRFIYTEYLRAMKDFRIQKLKDKRKRENLVI